MNSPIRSSALLLLLGAFMPPGSTHAHMDTPNLQEAVKAAFNDFSSMAMTPDGPVAWSGHGMSMIGAGPPAASDSPAATGSEIRVFARQRDRLGRFDIGRVNGQWAVIQWSDLSLQEAESGVRATLGEAVYHTTFGRFDSALPTR